MNSWATRSLFTCQPRIARVVMVMGLVLIAGMIAAPGLATLGWHLLYGNSIVARGKKLFVPLGWIAETNDTMGVSLTKLPITILPRISLNGLISVGQGSLLPGEKIEERYKSFEKVYWNLAVQNAVVSGPIRIGTGAHEIFCMESVYPPATAYHAEARCLILQGKWEANFMGNEKDLGTFFEIIQKIN